MPKYRVYVLATASKCAGEYEAASAKEAEDMCEKDPTADYHFSVNIGNDFDMGDVYAVEAEKVD